MAKNRSKSGTKKKRSKDYGGPGSSAGENAHEGGGGAMQSMVGGFRRAVGVEKKSKKGRADVMWTILLVLAVAAILFWRFGPS